MSYGCIKLFCDDWLARFERVRERNEEPFPYAGTIYAFYPSTSLSNLVESPEIITRLPHVTRVYLVRHRLDLKAGVMDEVRCAAACLRAHHLIAHGTGLQRFPTFAIQF